MKWSMLAATICVMGAAVFGQTGPATTDAGKAAEKPKKVVIGMIAKSSTNDVFVAAHQGARDAAKELAGKYGVEVVLDIRTPDKEDPLKQAEAVEQLTRDGAQGILVSCTNANTLTKAINNAVDKGVAVMTFDSDAPASKRFAYYGNDDITMGKKLGELIAKQIGGKGTVAILAGNQAAPNLQTRVKGVQAALANYPEIKQLAIGPVYHEETANHAADKIKEIQRQHPEIKGWAMVGGWPLFAADALPWKPGDVKVVSADALPQQLTYVKGGYAELLGQDCYGWGHKGVEILLDKIVNKKDPATADKNGRIFDALTLVNKENMEAYEKSWRKWLGQ